MLLSTAVLISLSCSCLFYSRFFLHFICLFCSNSISWEQEREVCVRCSLLIKLPRIKNDALTKDYEGEACQRVGAKRGLHEFLIELIDRSARSQGETFAFSYQRPLGQDDNKCSDPTKDEERWRGIIIIEREKRPHWNSGVLLDSANSLLYLEVFLSEQNCNWLLLLPCSFSYNSMVSFTRFSFLSSFSPLSFWWDDFLFYTLGADRERDEENKRESSFGRRERRSTRYSSSLFHRSNHARYLPSADLLDYLVDNDRTTTSSVQCHHK
jgi:hypothetical protein